MANAKPAKQGYKHCSRINREPTRNQRKSNSSNRRRPFSPESRRKKQNLRIPPGPFTDQTSNGGNGSGYGSSQRCEKKREKPRKKNLYPTKKRINSNYEDWSYFSKHYAIKPSFQTSAPTLLKGVQSSTSGRPRRRRERRFSVIKAYPTGSERLAY